MACTKTIQDSVNWVATILKQQPLNVSNWEPGLTFANLVLERVLGPPMKWRFNRGNLNFPITTAGGRDSFFDKRCGRGWSWLFFHR